jgi:Uma2 family endonuclease
MSITLKKPKTKKLKSFWSNKQKIYVSDHPITIDEFCDLVDGVITEKMATQFPHEDLFRFLFVILNLYADKKKSGTVLGSRTLVPITLYKGRLPDILFVSKERESIIGQKRLTDAPDLVIEIISPWDRPSEVMQRIENYQEIGVKELWIVDQPQKQMQVFIFDEFTKTYSPLEYDGSIFHSKILLGFWLKVDWLWQKPLPSVLEVFKEIAGAL